MKKLLLLFGLYALLLTSCTSNSSSSSVTAEADVLLMKTIETYANDGSVFTTDFTYSGKKLVSTTESDGVREVYTYTGDLITNRKTYDATDTLQSDETFTYNTNNLLVSYVTLEPENDKGRKEVFVHNSNGSVSFTVYTGTVAAQNTLRETGTITSTNGEINQVTTLVASPVINVIRVYTYDTKNNPYKNVVGFDKLNFLNEEAYGILHNVLTDHYTSDFGVGTDQTTTTTYTYTTLNFPATSSEILDTDATTVVTTQFFYN